MKNVEKIEVLTTFVESVEIDKNIRKIETSKRGEIMNTTKEKTKYFTLKYDQVFKSIIVDNNDYTVMNNILSDILDREVKVKRYYNTELKTKNKKTKENRLDVVLETTDGTFINLELNSNYDKSIKIRNYIYYSGMCSELSPKGKKKRIPKEVIQINLNFNEGNNKPLKEEYYLRNKEGEILIENFRIINVNIERYKDTWYDKNIEGDKRYIYLTMLGTNEKELKKLAKREEKIREVSEKMIRFNEDGTITNVLTPEEDEEFVMELRRQEAYDNGVKNTAISMIKEKIPLKTVSKVTKINIKELKKLVIE